MFSPIECEKQEQIFLVIQRRICSQTSDWPIKIGIEPIPLQSCAKRAPYSYDGKSTQYLPGRKKQEPSSDPHPHQLQNK